MASADTATQLDEHADGGLLILLGLVGPPACLCTTTQYVSNVDPFEGNHYSNRGFVAVALSFEAKTA